jgi:hypothetical protein
LFDYEKPDNVCHLKKDIITIWSLGFTEICEIVVHSSD